ncbi:MAG: tol-pal system YbgF family protein [Bdellovibrionales bacterium]
MQLFIFSFFAIMLGWTQAFHFFKSHFSQEKFLAKEVVELKNSLEKERLGNDLLSFQMREFKQEVARILPDEIKSNPYDYNTRNLASVVGTPSDTLRFENASAVFRNAKSLFDERKFELAAVEYNKIVSFYPESIHIVESAFMLAESYYQLEEFESCMDVIESMMELFPEHVMTGFSLLRLGRIYEKYDQTENAIIIYRLIAEQFEDKKLKKQARLLIEEIAL